MLPAGPSDPFVKASLSFVWRDVKLELEAPHSAFASSGIDPGTRLLLENLPPGEPGAFLDLGCGYGALGLPIAARHPRSRGLLVDRDLLAVELCRSNASAHGLANVDVTGSLGVRDLPASWGPFDWILSNFPARAGERALEHFVVESVRRLAPGGEARVVVIAPLEAMVERIAERTGLARRKVAATAQHSVHAFSGPPGATGSLDVPAETGLEPYLRDAIELELPGLEAPLRLERPTDLADEPHRLAEAIPALAGSLPPELPPGARVLVLRCGYGLVPALALARYPRAEVTAMDRDLLGTAFTRRNCAGQAARLRIAESARLVLDPGGRPFDLVLGELLPSLGAAASAVELLATRAVLSKGGRAAIVSLSSFWRAVAREVPRGLDLVRIAELKSCSVRGWCPPGAHGIVIPEP